MLIDYAHDADYLRYVDNADYAYDAYWLCF